ncbi:unnamed protein product [Sphagnum balticum]
MGRTYRPTGDRNAVVSPPIAPVSPTQNNTQLRAGFPVKEEALKSSYSKVQDPSVGASRQRSDSQQRQTVQGDQQRLIIDQSRQRSDSQQRQVVFADQTRQPDQQWDLAAQPRQILVDQQWHGGSQSRQNLDNQQFQRSDSQQRLVFVDQSRNVQDPSWGNGTQYPSYGNQSPQIQLRQERPPTYSYEGIRTEVRTEGRPSAVTFDGYRGSEDPNNLVSYGQGLKPDHAVHFSYSQSGPGVAPPLHGSASHISADINKKPPSPQTQVAYQRPYLSVNAEQLPG